MKNRVPYLFALACMCLWGCAGGQDRPAPLTPRHARAQSVRTYVLGREPDQAREQAFQDLLAAAYATALKNRESAPETGFSYSLSPKGTVYPFSEVEVVCLVQKADYSQAKGLCGEFFKAVDAGLSKVGLSR